MKFTLSPRILAALVAVLLVLSFIPTSDGPALEALFSRSGLGKIDQAAQSHLEEQREQALKGFLLLSALKVALAVLKSSEVGFILNVKVGDLAVAVYDYVDLGWKILLAAVAYYYIAEYLMMLASVVNIWFLWISLVSVLAWILVSTVSPRSLRLKSAIARTGMAGTVLAVLLYAGLPLSLIGANWVSAHITNDSIDAANRFYEDMGNSMPSLLKDESLGVKGDDPSGIRTSSVTVPVPYDGTDPSQVVEEGPGGAGTGLLSGLVSGEKIREFKDYLQQRSKSLASAVLRQTAAYLFNIVVFPLLMLMVLYLTGKYLIGLTVVK